MTSSVQAVAPQSIWRLFGLHKINWLKSHWAADSSPHIVTTGSMAVLILSDHSDRSVGDGDSPKSVTDGRSTDGNMDLTSVMLQIIGLTVDPRLETWI
jgi:hypothetical protein